MKTREDLIDEMAKAIYATGVALDGTDYAFGVYDDDDHFHRMASALIAANIGDITAWKERAEKAEKERERLGEAIELPYMYEAELVDYAGHFIKTIYIVLYNNNGTIRAVQYSYKKVAEARLKELQEEI